MKCKNLLLAVALCLAPACKTADVATPEENARIADLTAQEEAAAAAGDDAAAAKAAGERGELETSIAERAVGGVIDTIDAFVPVPLQPFKGALSALAALIAFPRSRSHLKRGVRAIAKADVRELGKSILRIPGLMHSNDDPLEVLAGAAAAARAKGNEAEAVQIEALIETMKASA